jgi:hypothetical protein
MWKDIVRVNSHTLNAILEILAEEQLPNIALDK